MRPPAVIDYTPKECSEDREQTNEIRVLFTNTAGYFGPPMQVHYHIMKHLLPPAYRLFMATNGDEVTAARFRQLDHIETSQFNLGATRPMDVSTLGRTIQLLLHIPVIISVFRLIMLIRKQRIDIIHATSEPRAVILAVILSTLCRTKLVIFAHSWNLDRSFPRNFGVAWAMRRADAVVSPSHYIRNRLVSRGVDASKAWVTWPVTDLDEFNPDIDGTPVRHEYGIEPHTLLIVAVGRINEEKGQICLLKALALVKHRMPEVRALLVGWADPTVLASGKTYEQELKDYCAGNGLSDMVTFAGPRSDIPQVNAAADILTPPSTVEEAFCLTSLEGMASGKPVIGFQTGGVPESLSNDTGILVKQDDHKALADAILSLIASPELCDELGKRARARVEKEFYESRLAAQFAEVYESLH